jgi:predicted ATP-grasp superfamily ATP-dependent carboligase
LARILVLDGHCSAALAFVRSLGRAGHWLAVGADGAAPAALSRYCALRWTYASASKGASRFVEAVHGFVRQQGIDLVLPMTDATTAPLARHRERFKELTRLAVSPLEVYELASDKYQTIELARRLGVPVPQTRLVSTLDELEEYAERDFPLVVKDRCSFRWIDDRAVAGSVSYAFSREELRAQVARRLEQTGDVLVQAFAGGTGIGFSCFAWGGETFLPFQWKRIREKDPRGSGSSARRSVPLDPQVVQWSRALLLEAGFQGLAMVEFKQDPASGRLVLMEINGRPWGSLALPVHCGIDYPLHAVRWYLDGQVPPRELPYSLGITCRDLTADLVHLENLWQGRPPGWTAPYPNFWASLVRVAVPWYPGLRYDEFSWRDPSPGLAELGGWVRQHLGGQS